MASFEYKKKKKINAINMSLSSEWKNDRVQSRSLRFKNKNGGTIDQIRTLYEKKIVFLKHI